MNVKPIISVIIPVYCVEKYIGKCIQSLLDQTYTNFEALIVDDGSPDQSIAIAKKMVGEDPRFIFLEKENGGQASARNMGLEYVSGEYITFIDSDDFIDKLTFEYCMKHLQADITIDIVAFGMQYIEENGLVLGQTMPNIEDYYQQRDILLLNGSIDTSMCTKVYKTQLFFEHRFIDGMIYEDQEILPKILYGKKVVQIPYYLYNYVIHVGSTMRRYNESYLESFILLFNRHKDFLLRIKAFDELSVYYEKGYILNFYINSITYISIYSPDFRKDVRRLDDLMDKKIINLFNIIKLLPIKPMRCIGILIFKISPIAFKFFYKKIKG